jgi:hypothetical protein
VDEDTVFKLGLILATSIRVLGMQASNMQREHRGESMMYNEADFFIEAYYIEMISRGLQP